MNLRVVRVVVVKSRRHPPFFLKLKVEPPSALFTLKIEPIIFSSLESPVQLHGNVPRKCLVVDQRLNLRCIVKRHSRLDAHGKPESSG